MSQIRGKMNCFCSCFSKAFLRLWGSFFYDFVNSIFQMQIVCAEGVKKKALA